MTKRRCNGGERGNIYQRKARRWFLINKFGDGSLVECQLRIAPECIRWLTYDSMSIDKWPIPGSQGGTYARNNIRPVCLNCNSYDGGIQSMTEKQFRNFLKNRWAVFCDEVL